MVEVERLLRAETFDDLRKGLRGDADGLNLVSGLGEFRLGGAQHGEGICYLLAIVWPIEADKSGHSPDLGLLLGQCRTEGQKKNKQADERFSDHCSSTVNAYTTCRPTWNL